MLSTKIFQKCFGLIAVILTAMMFSSCNAKVQDKKNKNFREGAVAVLGDKKKCIYTGPPDGGSSTPLKGTWDSLDWQETETLRFTFSLVFLPVPGTMTYNLQFTNYCTHKETNRRASATVTTTIIDQIRYFEVAKSLYKDSTEKFPDFEINCDAESVAGPFQYKFDGDCLVIDGGYYTIRK